MSEGITKIKKLFNIGIFENFTWPNNTPDLSFKKINILYGFNGSGKTTLSSVIDMFSEEHSESRKREIAASLASDEDTSISFNIEWDDNSVTSYLDTKKVYVFNSHFITEHVYDGTNSKVKLFKGGIVTSDHLANPTIKKLTDSIDTDNESKKSVNETIAELESLAIGLKTSLSKLWNENINGHRMPAGLDLQHFEENVSIADEDELLNELNEQFKLFKVTNNQDVLQRDIALLDKIDLVLCHVPEDLALLLTRSISQSAKDNIQNKINTYKASTLKHSSHQNWFEDGAILLKNSTENGICPLCDSEIIDIEEIILKYDEYFSDELSKLINTLQSAADAIGNNCEVIETWQEQIRRIQEILARYQFHSILNDTEDETLKNITLGDIRKSTKRLEVLINHKKNDITREINQTDREFIGEVMVDISELNDNFRTIHTINEKLVEKLKGSLFNLRNAKEICSKLFWSRFDDKGKDIYNKYRDDAGIEKPQEQGGIKFYCFLNKRISRLNEKIDSNERRRENELSKLKKESEYVNEFLSLLCVTNFSINIDDTNEVIISYVGKKPKKGIRYSLSEGEKTALALSYFLSKYKYEVMDNQNANIKQEDYIIVIDDPVSSLDENRLFSTALVIQQYLFPHATTATVNDQKVVTWTGCKQLIVTSHNLIFLKFLSNVMNSDQNKVRADFYLEEGHIQVLPAWFRNYQTSYFYKLAKLDSFANKEIDYSIVKDYLPNYIRVILEAFLSFKFARLRGKEKYLPPMLGKLILQIDMHDFSHYKAVKDIRDKDSLKLVLQEINNKVNPESHGTVQDITHLEYLSEAELRKLAKQAVNVIQFFDQMHYSATQNLNSTY